MAVFRSQATAIVAAAMLPLLVLAGFQLYSMANSHRLDLESTSRARAEEIVRLVDAQMTAEVKMARVLASAATIRADDMPGAYRRAAELAAITGAWRTVRLSDPTRGVEVFDLRRPFSVRSAPIGADAAAVARRGDAPPAIGDVVPDPAGGYEIPLQVPVMREGRVRYVLTIEIDPASLHRLAMARYPSVGVVSAVVDRRGRFISRTLHYGERVGRPASAYVRAAVRRGGSGFYRGTTLEGAASYSAYATSALTGWSAHIAVSASPFDVARQWSLAIWLAVIAGCLLLAGFMVTVILRDLAAARTEEARQRQSQKLEAMGQLTGGIAHDFNNLLTVIIGGLDLVLRRLEPGDRNRRHVEAALDAAQRGAKLTSRLLAFSRTQRLGLEPVDVAAAVTDMRELLEHSLGASVRLEVRIAPDAGWVRTDRNQLELALLNLAVNARDAMPEGGLLTIEARRVASDGREDVELSITDTGAGMEPRVLERAFDPFFTTKPVNEGTGLGLAQVYGLARQSEGEVTIESAVGQGTCVRLTLPAAEPPSGATRPPEPEGLPDLSATSGARILVVDDDDGVREVLAANLRARGYAVSEAASGAVALEAMARIDPDLMIVDFVMPGMNGAEFARQVRDLRPGQKLLIVSGHLDNMALDSMVRDAPILRKPFDGPTLAARVAALLAE